ncbi:MAG: hypothetical protein WCF94_00125 [bacterium]
MQTQVNTGYFPSGVAARFGFGLDIATSVAEVLITYWLIYFICLYVIKLAYRLKKNTTPPKYRNLLTSVITYLLFPIGFVGLSNYVFGQDAVETMFSMVYLFPIYLIFFGFSIYHAIKKDKQS